MTDYLFENQSEDFHESHKDRFIFHTEIAELLKTEGLDPHKIADETLWSRLESPLPNLCADRLDYTLRDYVLWAGRPASDVQKFIGDLRFQDGFIVVITLESAQWFKEFFQELNEKYFAHPKNREASLGLTQILKKALSNGFLTRDDLFTDDEVILSKLSRTPLHREIDSLKQQLRRDELPVQTLQLKKRAVDPWVLYEGATLKRLSEIAKLRA